jgi:hypothetical protein
MSLYFSRLAQRSGIDSMAPPSSKSADQIWPTPSVHAPPEQSIEVEAPAPAQDQLRQVPMLPDRHDDSPRRAESLDAVGTLLNKRPSKDRPDEDGRPARMSDLSSVRSQPESNIFPSSPQPERSVKRAGERSNADPWRPMPHGDAGAPQLVEGLAPREQGSAVAAPLPARAVDPVARRESTKIELGHPSERSATIDLLDSPATRLDPAVEVHIGTVTLQVSAPKPTAAMPTSVRRDTFAPYRHYLRAW